MEAMQELEARKYVWMGAIPLQIHLHESEIATLPAPPPALVLGPRNGYLPLLTSLIKPHFQGSLPPGTDTVWFDYKGLPLKWYIPIGVLFDLLCAEPERPWNITVHFRGYPVDILSPCEGEDNVKWSFINSLKEASYIMNGSTKNVMNMSQADQVELWRCVMKGDIEGYGRVSSRLRPGPVVEDSASGANTSKILSQRRPFGENESLGASRTGRIPLRLYLRDIREELDDLAAAPPVESWDEITYINRPVELPKDEGLVFTLWAALASVLPGLFSNRLSVKESKGLTEPGNNLTKSVPEDESSVVISDDTSQGETNEKHTSASTSLQIAREGQDNDLKTLEGSPKASLRGRIEIIRVQGIEPSLDLPFDWVIQNLVAPEHFLHICIYTRNVAESR